MRLANTETILQDFTQNTSHDSLLDGRFGRCDLMIVHDY